MLCTVGTKYIPVCNGRSTSECTCIYFNIAK